MGNPFDFAKPVIKFDKIDDMPKKPHTYETVMKALRALHKMVHAQAEHYGGKHGKLLPAQIAETTLLGQLINLQQEREEAMLDASDLFEQAAVEFVNGLSDEDLKRFGKLLNAFGAYEN